MLKRGVWAVPFHLTAACALEFATAAEFVAEENAPSATAGAASANQRQQQQQRHLLPAHVPRMRRMQHSACRRERKVSPDAHAAEAVVVY